MENYLGYRTLYAASLSVRRKNRCSNEKRTRKGCQDTNVQVRILADVAARTKQLLNDNVLVGRCTSSHFICLSHKKHAL